MVSVRFKDESLLINAKTEIPAKKGKYNQVQGRLPTDLREEKQ